MLTKKIFFIVWFLGLISGFTILITGNTLNFWLSKENIDIRTIGIFALISIPYAINFTWAPIFDIKKVPLLSDVIGARLAWVVTIQIFLSASVYLMSLFTPTEELISIAICGLIISFLASAQDTVLGAMRTELVTKEQQGAISGTYIFGYRIGMLISGYGAIYLSQYVSWNVIYQLFALIILVFPMILILWAKSFIPKRPVVIPVIQRRPQADVGIQTQKGSKAHNGIKLDPYVALRAPLDDGRDNNTPIIETNDSSNLLAKLINLIATITQPIGRVKYVLFILIFLILYRLPDNFITMMINPFLLHIGYNEFEISTVGKLFGIASAITGGLLASYVMKKKNLYDSLLMFGSMHAGAHMLFIAQEIYGHNLYLLFLVTGVESITGGMTMAAYIAFIASLCQGKFRATQYSFLSSMMGLSRSILPAISGYIVADFGWTIFYLFTTLATVPALVMVLYLKNRNSNSRPSSRGGRRPT